MVLREIVRKAEAEILEAGNGKEGLEVLEKNTVHLVISEISMPVMDGLEFLEKIRGSQSLKGLPFIVLTGDNEEKVRERAFHLGANDFVNKPMIKEDFLTRVKRYIG